jgi:hypothetical protein
MARFGLAVLLALVAGCGRDLVRDSAELDRALIPAIELAASRDPLPARVAMDELVATWDRFYSRHQGDRPDEPVWRQWLAAIDTLVLDVDEMADSADFLPFVAENLTDMRMMLVELRDSVGLAYYTDALHELDEPLDELHRLALARDSATLRPADTARFGALLDEARAIWDDAAETRFEPGRYGFDAERERLREYDAGRLEGALAELDEALAAGERRAVLNAARAVRPDFLDLYRLFGDYGGLQ